MLLIKYHIIKIIISYNHPPRLLALNIFNWFLSFEPVIIKILIKCN